MLYFNRTEEVNKDEPNGFDDVPMPDGEHLLVIENMWGPQESKKKSGTFYYFVTMRSVAEPKATLLYIMQCTESGLLLTGKDPNTGQEQGWKGQVKFNNLAEALGLSMGQCKETDIIRGCIKAIVKTKNGFPNIVKMWTPTEEEENQAAQWVMDNMS